MEQNNYSRRLFKLLFFGIALSVLPFVAKAQKNVMCLKTNTGQYIEVVRISMMAVVDAGPAFDILVKDGQGATGVTSVSFEKHPSDIDFSKYKENSDGTPYIDGSKPSFLFTNTGKYFKVKDMPQLYAKDGSKKFDVVVGNVTESDVEAVYFYRGDEEALISGIKTPLPMLEEEKLQLLTPVGYQLTLSGCGDAPRAIVYSMNGTQVGAAVVDHGVTTVNVADLPAGAYVVKVGKKALKFIKK